MSGFKRQLERNSLKIQAKADLAVIKMAQQSLDQMNQQNNSLLRALSICLLANGGEIRVSASQMEKVLKGKRLKSFKDEETGEFVFQVISAENAINK